MKHSDTLRCLLWLLALLLIGLGNLGVQAQPYALSSGAVVTAGDGGHLQATFGQPWSGEVGNGTMQIRLGFWAFVSAGAVSTDVEREAGEQPHRFRLDQNYPNPFNSVHSHWLRA